jgi:hypothetical protein
MDRTALMDANDQPEEIAKLCHSLVRTHFTNPFKPGMIQGVDRHKNSCKIGMTQPFYEKERPHADQLHFVKVSGA